MHSPAPISKRNLVLADLESRNLIFVIGNVFNDGLNKYPPFGYLNVPLLKKSIFKLS
jgi:hypothetical protein